METILIWRDHLIESKVSEIYGLLEGCKNPSITLKEREIRKISYVG